jgi:N utilization substance protein A
LLVKLFEMEVPEIYDGTVQIKAAVRAPGERAKVAVVSRERDVDPVGACVGMKGSRVQSIIRELRGEKIDIIEHSDDLVTFAQSALAPARITRVSVTHHGEEPHLDVIVEDEQLSLAIGKRGQNVRLAAELLGSQIEIKSESDIKDEVAGALAKMLQTAISEDMPTGAVAGFSIKSAPGVGAKTAEKLEEAGYGELDGLLAASPEQLEEVEGVGPKTAKAILAWAAEQAETLQQAQPEVQEGAAEPEAELAAAVMDEGDDFMAALSQALAEAEKSEADATALAESEDPVEDSPVADETPASDKQTGEE